MVRSAAMNDVGITVPGSESGQKFVTGAWFNTEETSHVIVLQLRGIVAGKAVKTAVTVKSKAKCETCGTPNKSSMKFCGKCGTSLAII
jgi:DnaJ-class molecular chaperone